MTDAAADSARPPEPPKKPNLVLVIGIGLVVLFGGLCCCGAAGSLFYMRKGAQMREQEMFAELEAARRASEIETGHAEASSSDAKDKARRCYGKIQYVDSFPDFKVEVVDSFADLNVQEVDSFPDGPGKWQIVDSFPDFKVQKVSSFGDFKIKYVSSFPGVQ